MAPEKVSALPGFKFPYSPIIIVTRRRADSETSEARGVEAHVSVQQSNLPLPQLKEATRKRDRNQKSPKIRALITTVKMKDGGFRRVHNKSIMHMSDTNICTCLLDCIQAILPVTKDKKIVCSTIATSMPMEDDTSILI